MLMITADRADEIRCAVSKYFLVFLDDSDQCSNRFVGGIPYFPLKFKEK